MKCQVLFSRRNKKTLCMLGKISADDILSSADFAQSVLLIVCTCLHLHRKLFFVVCAKNIRNLYSTKHARGDYYIITRMLGI